MNKLTDKLRWVHSSSRKKLLFLPHAVHQMARPERMITTSEIRSVIDKGEIIEDYPEDQRGYGCLMAGKERGGRPLHIVCAPKKDYCAIITAYLPSELEWSQDFKERKTK
jgi:hypothetical protein